MKIARTFADQLKDSLTTLALCAYHVDINKHKEIEEYAQNTYTRLLKEWEEQTGEKWEVIE